MISRGVSGCLILAGAELCFATAGAFSDTPQSHAHPSSPPAHARILKRTWQTGPASTPPETEVVPSRRSPFPPALRGVTLNAEGEKKSAAAPRVTPTPTATLTAKSRSGAAIKPAAVATPKLVYVDPDKRARNEMNCLSTNAQAREAFYGELRRTVDQVRAGRTDMTEKNPAPCGQ